MKRPLAIAVFTYLGFVAILLHSDIKDFLWTHPWWHSLLAALPEIALAVFAGIELQHSDEANTLRSEANEHRAEANRLRTRNTELSSQLDSERNTYLRQIAELTNELDAERNKHLAQIAINTARPSQEPAASLKIYPANRSRYILKPPGQGGAHGDFRGGHFQFWLRVENSGNRNSAVDKYKMWIQEFDSEFNIIVPIQVNGLVPGRHCQYSIGNEKYLNEANLIKIPADDSTNVGCLWFYLPELTLEMFANAGLRMQGPERRFGNLHCRLTVTDSNEVSASEDFECHED
jgi:hypothetical protein